MIGSQRRRWLEEVDAIGDPVAYKEVHQRRDGKIAEDLRQGVDLVLVAYSAHFEEREAGMHGQHQNGAHQNEQGIGTVDKGVHRAVHVFHEIGRPAEKGTRTVQEPASLHRFGASPLPCFGEPGGAAWFFLGFVVDWVKVYRYSLHARPESAQAVTAAPRNVANT